MRQVKRLWVLGVGVPVLLAACAPAGIGVGPAQRVPQALRDDARVEASKGVSASMLDALAADVPNQPSLALSGTVRIPVRWAGGGIVGNNGGSLIGHGGGHLIGNNTASVVSHNGGTVTQGSWGTEVPLAFATVSLRDATGAVLQDAEGRPMVTQTDAAGRYGFAVLPAGAHVVVTVQVPEQSQPLQAFVARDRTGVERGVDLISTLVMTYLQARFINGSQAVFDKLDPLLVEQAQDWLVAALVRDGGALPDTLSEASLVAWVDRLRAGDSNAQTIYEQVRARLVVVGGVAAMQGRDCLDWRLDEATALVRLPDGAYYIFERPKHLLWHITAAGQVRLALAGPQWGYAGQTAPAEVAHYPSGMVVDATGNVYVADTWNHRVVRYHPERGVQVVAGDGGVEGVRSLHYPTGLALGATGGLLVSDTRNGRVVKVSADGAMAALSLQGVSTLAEPMGMVAAGAGSWLVVEHGRDRVLRVSADGVVRVLEGAAVAQPTVIARRGAGDYGILSGRSHRVWRYQGGQLTPWSLPGVGQPVSLAADGGELYVGAAGVWRVGVAPERVLGATPERLRAAGALLDARSLTVNNDGRLLIADAGGHAVLAYREGQVSLYAGTGAPGGVEQGDRLNVAVAAPQGVGVDGSGQVWVLTGGARPGVLRITTAGQASRVADGAPGASRDWVVWPGALGAWLAPDAAGIRVLGEDGVRVETVAVPGVRKLGELPGGGHWVQTAGELREWGGSRVWLRAEAIAPWFAWDRIRTIRFVTKTRCFVASANSIVQVEDGRVTAVAGHHTLLLNGQEPDSGLFDIQDLAWVGAQGLYVLERTQLKLIPTAMLPGT